MLPDNINYNSVSLLEIEPFACGKGFILNIRNSIDILSNKYIPDSAQSLVFTKYFQTLLEEKYEFNWYKNKSFIRIYHKEDYHFLKNMDILNFLNIDLNYLCHFLEFG